MFKKNKYFQVIRKPRKEDKYSDYDLINTYKDKKVTIKYLVKEMNKNYLLLIYKINHFYISMIFINKKNHLPIKIDLAFSIGWNNFEINNNNIFIKELLLLPSEQQIDVNNIYQKLIYGGILETKTISSLNYNINKYENLFLQNFSISLIKNKKISIFKKFYLRFKILNRNDLFFNIYKSIYFYIKDKLNLRYSYQNYILKFSGVDGVGKSSIVIFFLTIFSNFKIPIKHIHLLPAFLPQPHKIINFIMNKKTNIDYSKPYINIKHKGSIISYIKYVYYFFLFHLNHLIEKYYFFKGYFYIYDRWYLDYWIDLKRTGINLELKKFPSLVKKNKYSLNFLLFAKTKLILSRKKELTEDKINELNIKYRKYIKFSNLNVIDTNSIFKKSINDVLKKVDDYNKKQIYKI